ncbi:Alpha/Beta hydrolase protein [Cristinia sonorae]|uniref:Alpha/Beta hydrolase protein n=1 Tax=Cristinia sonorae TaxID=1940300 RepID=A0A8K0UJT7_9AGAR|nr:Alpha/Beta hydrolase protein [Cristinia sonorae]
MPATASGRYITSKDGTRIWADDAGVKSGIPVVFIHGFACTALIWDKQFGDRTLARNLNMVRYELRGHGRSDHPEHPDAYVGERYAEDFMAVCGAFGISKPFVCAWSFGALIPVDVVEAFGPDQISGVIYPGGPALTLDLHKEFMHPFLLDFIALITKDADEINKAANMFVDSCLHNPQHALPFEKRLQWLAGFFLPSTTARMNTLLRKQSSKRWEKEFRHKPHLLIQGTADMHTETHKLIPIARKTLPEIEIKLVDDVGHAVAWEAPDKHNKYLLEFVRRHHRAQTRAQAAEKVLVDKGLAGKLDAVVGPALAAVKPDPAVDVSPAMPVQMDVAVEEAPMVVKRDVVVAV